MNYAALVGVILIQTYNIKLNKKIILKTNHYEIIT